MKKIPQLSENHTCFGAGPANTKGLRMQFYTDDSRVYSNLSIPVHMNSWQGLVHGGIVGTILDETMFYTAMYFFKCIALTKEVTVKLHQPVRFDQMPFTAVGEVSEQKTDTNGIITGRLYNTDGDLCAASTGNFALVKIGIIRRLGILTEQDIQMMEGILDQI